jgi:hypothetical protein
MHAHRKDTFLRVLINNVEELPQKKQVFLSFLGEFLKMRSIGHLIFVYI